MNGEVIDFTGVVGSFSHIINHLTNMLNQWICGILGLVVAVVPFLTLSETVLTWTLVIAGLAITVSSFWGMSTEFQK